MSFNKNTQKSSKSTLGFGNYGRYICSNGRHWRSGEGFILSLPYNQCSALQNDEDMFFSPHFANAVVIGSAR